MLNWTEAKKNSIYSQKLISNFVSSNWVPGGITRLIRGVFSCDVILILNQKQ